MKKTALTIALPFAMAMLFAGTPATADPLYDIRYDTKLWQHSFAKGYERCSVREGDRVVRDWGGNWAKWIYVKHFRYVGYRNAYEYTGCHGWFDKQGQDESDIRIVPHIDHGYGEFRAHTAGAENRILDQCDGLELTCTKNVWLTVRPELPNGQHTYLPYDVEVSMVVSRWGPFFPQTGTFPDMVMKVVIPAGRPGTTPFAAIKIPLALDTTPEYDARSAGNFSGVGEASASGGVVAGIESIKLLGRDRHYSNGPEKSDKTVAYKIYDKAAENMPEYRLVAQNTAVLEGDPITFELRGNKNPNFKMRVRADYAFPNGNGFFALDSRYRNILLEPNSGVDIGNGEYRFATFTVDTFSDIETTTYGKLIASIGDKKSGWHWNDQSWDLQPVERTGVTVSVYNGVPTEISDISHAASVVEGKNVEFQLSSLAAPVFDQRIRLEFAYSGDFFGPNPSSHAYVNIGPSLGSVDGEGTYTSSVFEISTVLDVVDESNGSVTATIGEKRLGHSESGKLIPLTDEERAMSSTVVIEDSVIPDFRIMSASYDSETLLFTQRDSFTEGSYMYFLILGDVKPNVDITVQMDFAYTGDYFGGYPVGPWIFYLRPNASNGGTAFQSGGYLFDLAIKRPWEDDVEEPDGSITATLSRIQVGPYGNRVDVPISENDESLSTTAIIQDNDDNVYRLETPSPTISAGGTAQWNLVSSAQTVHATSITVRFVDVGSTALFGAAPPATATISLAAGSGSEIADRSGMYLQQMIERTTFSTATGGSMDAAITSITETIPTSDASITRTRDIPIEEQTLVRVTINVPTISEPRSSSAMDAYREVSETHESVLVAEGTEGTQEQISLAFDRPSTMDVQAFVETVGTSINSGANLSELVNMPSFTMPLTSGTEVTGPLTMWIDSNDSDTLAVGHIGMDLSMYDSYVFGMTVSSLESELSEDISEDMNMVQSYLAYKPDDSDVHVSAIVGFGAGDLSMEEFGSFETSRILAQFGIHGDLASYGTESIDGNLKVDATAGISEHTVQETSEYYGWTTIGRNASILASSEHAISTPVGTFNPTIWTEFDSRLESGGGLTFDDLKPHGLSLSAWINGESPDSAKNFTADVKYGFSTTDSVVITPSLELATNNGLSHTLGVSIANDIFDFGGDVTDNSRYGINGAVRW